MFVGHYGPSFAIKSIQPSIRLWVLFIAVQLLDVGWSVLVILGVEKVRIVPGITASNPLDLYYMPFTHSLIAALACAVAAIILSRFLLGIRRVDHSGLLEGPFASTVRSLDVDLNLWRHSPSRALLSWYG